MLGGFLWMTGARRETIATSIAIALLMMLMFGSSCNALVSARIVWKTNTRGILSSSARCHLSRLQSLAGTQEFTTQSTDRSTNDAVSMKEIELTLAEGMILRGQHWTNAGRVNSTDITETTTKILALHGWLDNCRSFHLLAPKLLEKYPQPTEIVAMDLPGHGWSSHKPIGGPTLVLSEGIYYMAEMLDELGWTNENDKISLIGHSMGGSMAVQYAGVFPEHVSSVVSIDIYGPEPGDPENAAKQIRSHVVQRRTLGATGKPHALYPSLERAAERRQKAATMAKGGKQYLSLEAATEMVTRSMQPVCGEQDDDNARKGYKFRHDTRLLWPSVQYLTKEQIQSVLDAVECPVCLLAAEDGYPFDQDRIDRVVNTLQPQIHQILPGSHHLHADPDTADAVVDVICDFFRSNGEKIS